MFLHHFARDQPLWANTGYGISYANALDRPTVDQRARHKAFISDQQIGRPMRQILLQPLAAGQGLNRGADHLGADIVLAGHDDPRLAGQVRIERLQTLQGLLDQFFAVGDHQNARIRLELEHAVYQLQEHDRLPTSRSHNQQHGLVILEV